MVRYGASIDIGTSHIGIHIVSLNNCEVLGYSTESNPQTVFGSDIVSRLESHSRLTGSSLDLTEAIRSHIDKQLHEILDFHAIPIDGISDAIVVGNSAMHHLFFDLNIDPLRSEPFTGIDRSSKSLLGRNLGIASLNNTRIYSPPLVGGFIGNDAIAMVVDSDILDSESKTLMLDIGINTEVGVFDGHNFYFASAASGPAFEEMSISDGMIARNGAIKTYKLCNSDDKPVIATVGNTQPRGICGTGAISILATLLDRKLIDADGTFADVTESNFIQNNKGVKRFQIETGFDGIELFISQKDIRMLQQSKAAIRAAIEVLLQKTAISAEDIGKLYITGAFGSQLNMADAITIGLLPDLPTAEIVQRSSGALLGADKILCTDNRQKICNSIANLITYVNLSNNTDFDEQYAIQRLFHP